MASTRSQTKEETAPTCHVLNYYYDDANGFALTVLIHTLRFHIMVDFARLKSRQVQEEYKALLDAIEGRDGEQGTGKATSGKKRKRGDEEADGTDSGYGASPQAASATKRSAISSVTLADDDREDNDAVREVQNWILASFSDVFTERAPAGEERKPKTVHDWFHSPVYYYTLTSDGDGNMSTTEEEPTAEMEKEIAELVPGLDLPKYISSFDIPVLTTTDLQILETSDSPSPRHPAVVKSSSTGATHFLKLVDPTQPGPVKRELKMLKEIEAKGLHEQIRIPLVEGVVVDSPDASPRQGSTSASHRPRILGFLLTHISGATPLTTTLDADVAEGKRDAWSREVQRTVDVLHRAGFVWGDAKADNFVVDDRARLWIIDFGGSYTEGWVEPELNETLEGDDMGAGKIVDALKDPEGFTFDPDEEEHEEKEAERDNGNRAGQVREDTGGRLLKKRKTEDGQTEEDRVRKMQHDAEREPKTAGAVEAGAYCYCGGTNRGTMVGCDGDGCAKEWFHAECIGGVPSKHASWYCDECKA